MSLPEEILEHARGATVWQADLVAVPARVLGDDRSRRAAALIVAGDVPVHADIGPATSAEPGEVAEALEVALAEAAANVGIWPEVVVVRHGEVAEFLRSALRPRDCAVEVEWSLDPLDSLASDLVLQVGKEDIWPASTPPVTWAAWGLPEGMVEELFCAYAALYRAAPWQWFDDTPAIVADWYEVSGPWAVSVMGAETGLPGLAVYARPQDLESGPSIEIRDWVIEMGFFPRSELPEPMLEEIALAGWEVEDVAAYPYILPFLTPGGGLQKELVRRLIRLLHGVAAFSEEFGDQIHSTESGFFSSADDDLSLGFLKIPPGDPSNHPPTESLRDFLEVLTSIDPIQAQALVRAGFDHPGPMKLSEALDASELEGAAYLVNARAFLTSLMDSGGMPATDAGNLKRSFVAEMLERMRFEDGYLDDLFRMNKVINEMDVGPLHVLRVNLELAELVKLRRNRFYVSRMGKEMAQPGAEGRLFAHLFRMYFGRFNIHYPGRGPDSSDLQSAVPLLLWQLGVRARDWTSLRSLANQILPLGPAILQTESRTEPRQEEMDFYFGVLRPLLEFGLLEERDTGEPDRGRWRPEERELRTTPLYRSFLQFEW